MLHDARADGPLLFFYFLHPPATQNAANSHTAMAMRFISKSFTAASRGPSFRPAHPLSLEILPSHYAAKTLSPFPRLTVYQ
jgi:hypothetical protein